MEVWWRRDTYILLYVLYALLLYLIPGCWRMYVVSVVSSSVCVPDIKLLYTWYLVAGVCMLYLSYPAVYVF